MAEDEMLGQGQQLNRHEFEQTLGDSEGQGSLQCCSSWGCKESDITQHLNNNYTPGTDLNTWDISQNKQAHFNREYISMGQEEKNYTIKMNIVNKRIAWYVRRGRVPY